MKNSLALTASLIFQTQSTQGTPVTHVLMVSHISPSLLCDPNTLAAMGQFSFKEGHIRRAPIILSIIRGKRPRGYQAFRNQVTCVSPLDYNSH
jgi:hypothetical protein